VLWAAAKVQVPFWPVPMTLQSMFVVFIGCAFGWRLGSATVILYLLEGFMGLPVFAKTPPEVAGPLYFLGSTGGYLAGFVVAAAFMGWFAERFGTRSVLLTIGAALVAHALLLILGFVWLASFAKLASGATGMGLDKAFAVALAPYWLWTSSLVKSGLVGVSAGLLVQFLDRSIASRPRV
jgi:biotin transport system substrate-specific component